MENVNTLDSIGRVFSASNFDHTKFLFISTQRFNSSEVDVYKTYLDDELYNSTCYLVTNKYKGDGNTITFKIVNPLTVKDNPIECFGIIVSKMLFMDLKEESPEYILSIPVASPITQSKDGRVIKILKPASMSVKEYDISSK